MLEGYLIVCFVALKMKLSFTLSPLNPPPPPKKQTEGKADHFWDIFSREIFSTPTSFFASQRSFLRKSNNIENTTCDLHDLN